MAHANGMNPVVLMLVVQVALAGVNIFFKLAISSGVSLPVLTAYRFLFSTVVMVPLAFFFNGKNITKLTWKIIFQGFLCGIFGGSLGLNLYVEGMALTSATFASAVINLLPVVTFIVGIFVRLERLEFGTWAGKAKVLGTLMGLCGAMVFTFYKGFSIDFLKSNINLLPNNSSSQMASPASHQHVLGAFLCLGTCFSYAIWIIIQAKMSETLPCHYTSTALMCVAGFFQSTIYALCVERDWTQWKFGWDIRLWTAAYSVSNFIWIFAKCTWLCVRTLLIDINNVRSLFLSFGVRVCWQIHQGEGQSMPSTCQHKSNMLLLFFRFLFKFTVMFFKKINSNQRVAALSFA